MKLLIHIFVSFALCAVAIAGAAPPGIPVLEISGNIGQFTDPAAKVYRLSEAQFLALPQSSIITGTNWTPVSKFTGVRMDQLMRLTKARGEFVELHALDDYSVRIPVSDFKRYGIVLARSMNGAPLDLSTWGPYFLVYPKDQFPKELDTPTTEAKFVWQVHRIIFR